MKGSLVFTSILLVLSAGYVKLTPAQWEYGRTIDLTYDFDEQTIYWPTAEGFRLDKVADGVTEKGYYYSANNFHAAEHGGTHIDAPIHFFAKGNSVDQIPAEQLIGQVVVIDVSDTAARNADYQVGVRDLTRWEARNGPIPRKAIVFIRTGWGKFWPDRRTYLGTADRGEQAVPKLHFPGLHPEAADWLIDHRAVKSVGIDTASIDYGQSTGFETHRALFARNVPAFENVAHMDELPLKGARVVALPMKIRHGSGGPLRIVALLPARSR